jgi:hypothetical protein
MKNNKKEFDESWLNMLSDEERAGVMKVQITEGELTKRTQIEAESKVLQANSSTDGFWFIKALWAVVALGVTAAGTCVGYEHVESQRVVQLAKIQAEHPAPPKTVPAPTASAPVQP